MWVHEMRIQASSAERDSLLLCPYTVHRHFVWATGRKIKRNHGMVYKNGTTRSQNPYAAGFTDQKLYARQIGVNGIMVGYCVLLKFQFAYKSRL